MEDSSCIAHLKENLAGLKANKQLLNRQIADKSAQIEDNKIKSERLIKARWLLVEAAKATQASVKEYLESLTTKLMQAAYDRPLHFLVDYETKRNRSNCFLQVQDGDNAPSTPKEDDGGGMVEIISTALRLEMWSLQQPRSRNTIFLDEPLKNLGRKIGPVSQMLRKIAVDLGLQLVIITHDTEVLQIADRSWVVEHNGSYSVVTQNEMRAQADIPQPVKRIKKRLPL